MTLHIILGVVVYIILFMIGFATIDTKENESSLFLSLLPFGVIIQVILFILVFFRSPRVFWKNIKSLFRGLFYIININTCYFAIYLYTCKYNIN